MQWIIIVLLLIRITLNCGARGEENNTAQQTVTKASQTKILRDELNKLLDHNLPNVTNEAHDEVKQLNTLITSAVSQNAYSNKNFRAPDENILKLKPHSLFQDSTFNLGSADAGPSSNSEIAITHNIIESNIKLSDFLRTTTNTTIWHPNLISKTHLNRELLKLNSIEQNFNFNFENFTHIKLWKLIKINLSTNVLIGMSHNLDNMGSKLILINEYGLNFSFIKILQFTKIINDMDVIKIGLHKYLVTIENETIINFYEITVTNVGADYELKKINEINLHKKIVHMKVFYKRLDKIRIIFVTEYGTKISADLYDFKVRENFNFWLIKSIPLLHECHSIAILDTGRDYIIAFPQKDEVIVYQYENNMFNQLESIKTDTVTDVSGFSMGGYSYLAVGGYNPQILRYHRGQLLAQSILSQSFGLVEQWFPISARTHRDDLLLLVQHQIQFSTHSLSVLQALIWDGEAFNIVPTTPCYRNGFQSKYGITCMIDIEQETNIEGSVIIQHGKNISILVPRGVEASQLFNLNIEVVAVPNPLQQDIDEFNSIYKILSTLVENFDNSIQQIKNAIENSVNPEEHTVITGNWDIDTLEFENTFIDTGTKINTVFVGEIAISKQESEFDLAYLENMLDQSLAKLEESINQRPKREENLGLKDIQFEFLNGIPADELLFATQDVVELHGVQEFESSIYVGNDVVLSPDGKINGISIRNDTVNSESEVVLSNIVCDEIEILENLLTNDINGKAFNQENMGRLLDDSTRNTITVEEMHIGGNLNVTQINNVDFEYFSNKIVFKNELTRMEQLSIDGHILVETEFGINFLNEIPFPDGFVFRNSKSQQDIIRGHKTFAQSLVTNEIDTDGEINGIKPSDIVTLGDSQFIPGEITFSHIEVTESLEVNGTIKGQHLDKFLANPTMRQTNVINASCSFHELEVTGNVYLINIEKINLGEILENVVYMDQTETIVEINALKVFNVVFMETDQFMVTSNLINNQYSLDKYVAKSANQMLNINYLNGSVKFDSILLSGLFNGINVTELDFNSIKIGGDQYIGKRVKFQQPIIVKNLKILEKINKKSINHLINVKSNGPIRIDSNMEIGHLEVGRLVTNGSIQSENGEINGINLQEFNEIRFSLSRPQKITGKFGFKAATVYGDLSPNYLNDISMSNFKTLIESKKNTVADIFAGKMSVRNILVKGNVTINNINGFNMDKVIKNVIWLDRPNVISNRLTFLDAVTIHGDLETVSHINSKFILNDIFTNLVYRNVPIIIDGKKIFTNGIQIYGDYETDYINDIACSDLILSNRMNHVSHKIIIDGNLQVKNLTVPYINDLDMTELTSVYHFNEDTKTHVLNINNVEFTSPQDMIRLYVDGSMNDIFHVDEFLKNVVQLDRPTHFSEELKLFQNHVMFNKNLVIEKLNSIDLEEYFEHLVHIDEKDPVVIDGNVEFVEEITFDHMRIGGNLVTDRILNYDPNDWVKHDYFINTDAHVKVPMQFEWGTFQAAAIGVKFLNGIDMSKILTYNTDQIFEDDFHVSEIVSNVPVHVDGLVNNMKLPEEMQNTMMLTGNTTTKIRIKVKHVSVNGSVNPPDLINGKSLQNLIKIEANTISTPMTFRNIQTKSIITHGDISGIDFDLWQMQSMWKQGRSSQTVTAKYKIANLAIGDGGIHGTGLINNKSLNEVVETRNRDQLKLMNELVAYREEAQFICMNLRNLIELSKHQIYYVKYFDDKIMLENDESKINTKLFFIHNRETYLLISSANCHTTVYKWNDELIEFEEVIQFESGYISEWVQIYGEPSNETILVSLSVTNGFDKCNKIGVYMWNFDGDLIVERTALNIQSEYEIKSLWTSDRFPNNLFLISEGKNREPNVFQFSQLGKIENQWRLPINHRNLQFLPPELVFYLALSDGSQLFLINDYGRQGERVKRQSIDKLRELFKSRHEQLFGRSDSKPFKIGTKTGKCCKRGLLEVSKSSPVVSASADTTTTTTSTEPYSTTASKSTEATKPSPMVDSPQKPDSLFDTAERVLDYIFEKVAKISEKTAKPMDDDTLGAPNIETGPKDIGEVMSKDIFDTTLNTVSKIEQANSRITKDHNVGSPLAIDKENISNTINTGYPHVKNITKSFVVTAVDTVDRVQKVNELAENLSSTKDNILSTEVAPKVYAGYKDVKKVTQSLINSSVNTVVQADELANKFELNNDNHHDSEGTSIAVREIQDSQSITNVTGPNSTMVATPLNPAYDATEKTSKNLVNANIKVFADIEDFKEKLKHPQFSGNPPDNSDEFVIAPNPSYTTPKPVAVQPTTGEPPQKFGFGANIFNPLRRSRIGEKQIKASLSQSKLDDGIFDRTIGQEITYNGVIASENMHIPEKGTGEILVLHVGSKDDRRMLTVISTKSNESKIPGKHDTIKIYDDILEGKVYQEIHATKPSGLTALHIGDQTMLAFLEDKVTIQLYIYHGIEGFRHFDEYKLPMTASHLSGIALPQHGPLPCPRYFLVVRFTHKLWFLEAIMEGNCGVDIDLDCNLTLLSLDD